MLGFGMGRNYEPNEGATEFAHENHNTTDVSTHSPVPYLFGGVAAMLALVAVALLILACSFWKLSGHFEQSNNHGHGDDGGLECGEKKKESGVFREEDSEQRVIVIMAGDDKPTFLAKPAMPVIASGDDVNKAV